MVCLLRVFSLNLHSGSKATDKFDMLFYMLFYTMIFFAIVLSGKYTNKRLSGLKVCVLSFLISACFLLFWNFVLGPIYLENDHVGGVSSVLSSVLSVAILALCSITLGLLQYFYKRVLK